MPPPWLSRARTPLVASSPGRSPRACLSSTKPPCASASALPGPRRCARDQMELRSPPRGAQLDRSRPAGPAAPRSGVPLGPPRGRTSLPPAGSAQLPPVPGRRPSRWGALPPTQSRGGQPDGCPKFADPSSPLARVTWQELPKVGAGGRNSGLRCADPSSPRPERRLQCSRGGSRGGAVGLDGLSGLCGRPPRPWGPGCWGEGGARAPCLEPRAAGLAPGAEEEGEEGRRELGGGQEGSASGRPSLSREAWECPLGTGPGPGAWGPQGAGRGWGCERARVGGRPTPGRLGSLDPWRGLGAAGDRVGAQRALEFKIAGVHLEGLCAFGSWWGESGSRAPLGLGAGALGGSPVPGRGNLTLLHRGGAAASPGTHTASAGCL